MRQVAFRTAGGDVKDLRYSRARHGGAAGRAKTIHISGVTGANAGDIQGQATITNDDAAVAAAAFPTASEWALIAMTLLLALAGANAIKWG